jgi:two-component system CheB/CheR fusion protein
METKRDPTIDALPTGASGEIVDTYPPDETPRFPIVGVGASAGGLEAFTRLLKALPADTGMAFVLVQHLAPSHASALAEILARATSMPVSEVEDDSTVEPNRVYVIPPGQNMVISRGTLQIMPREAHGQQRPIDKFFRALAEDQGHRAIGVVLSGTASDGTLGLQAIKGDGGITFAQDDTAQHVGMPQSAIASGCVDFVLSPEGIANEITRIGRHPYRLAPAKPESESSFKAILQLLRRATGVDLGGYKASTLHRRVNRRMVLQKKEGLAEYLALLRENPAELEALYQDILIRVTRFFRDPESFEVLKRDVFPRLIEGRSPNDPLRIWTLGCSTGEEAYSLAIAFTELSEASGSQLPLQLFATDLNATNIEKARAGVYPKDVAQDISSDRLSRYFLEIDGRYRISKTVRDACVFSRHNALLDPPFSRIDLIACRNLLIYLEPAQQQRVLRVLHYALKPAGFLWLGSSETVGSSGGLFEVSDARHKLYARKPGSHTRPLSRQDPDMPREGFPASAPPRRDSGAELQRDAERILLSRFAPPGVLVSSDLEILQYRGDTGPYLSPSPGKASLNLLRMLPEGFLVAVRAAILRAGEEGAPVRTECMRVDGSEGPRELGVEVIPVKGAGKKDGGFWVLFDEASPRRGPEKRRPPTSDLLATDQHRLVRELTETREYLQSVIEQQEAANEELQSANEEVQSANEELQSVNEELETSKEEIQSTNEELATVNDELRASNTELSRVNSDLLNLLGNAQIPIVILGRDLCVRRFTAAAEQLLDLTRSNIGRPFSELGPRLKGVPDLASLLGEVTETGGIRERQVTDGLGRWYSLRLRPYMTLESKIDGVVAVLVDIDALKRAEAFAEGIVANLRDPILVLDAGLRVRTASRAFYESFRVTPEETQGLTLYDLGDRQWDCPELRLLLEKTLPLVGRAQDIEVERTFPRIGKRTMLLNARRLVYPGEDEASILLSVEDVTEHRRVSNELRRDAAALTEADRHKNEFLSMLAHELRNPLAPIRHALQVLELSPGDGEAHRNAREMMGRQIDQMVRLVDDLLDVSRISRGTMTLRQESIDLTTTVRHAIEAAQPAFDRKRQGLIVKLTEEPVYLNGDPTRLTQIVGNLLDNSCKFSSEGSRIWIDLAREGSEAVLRIRDTGVGIAAGDLPHIFEMFTQVDTSLSQTVGGLGIGLPLVKRLAEMHGGTVEATSAGVGQGSEFVVRLPIRVEPPEPRLEPVLGPEPTAARILVVDDNRDAADTLVSLLELMGNETRAAYEGSHALDDAEAFRPDVVLVDIGLPGISGYEVAREIRRRPWGKTTVLIAVTGWGQDEVRRKTAEAGFDRHIVKPAEPEMLLRAIEELRRSR